MTRIDDAARTLNTVGLAAWFGGSLMGAVSLANVSGDGSLEFENDAWRRWSPVQTAAIAAHLVGAAKLATTNKGRLGAQRGVTSVAIFKAACTAGALGATIYASQLGRAVHREVSARREDGDEAGPSSSSQTPTSGSSTVKRLRAVQAAVPILTGAMLVADARLGEQQRPMQVLRGAAERFVPDSLQAVPAALQSVPGALHSLPESLHSLPGALHTVGEKLQAVPVGDASRDLVAKAGALAGSASTSGVAQPIRKALHH